MELKHGRGTFFMNGITLRGETGKNTAIRRTAVRETGVFWHLWVQLRDS